MQLDAATWPVQFAPLNLEGMMDHLRMRTRFSLHCAAGLMTVVVWLSLGQGLIAAESSSGQERASRLGRKADFNLRDYRGKQHSLSDYRAARLVVLAFLGTECPLVKLYGPRLAELHHQFNKQGVVFLGVNANQHDSITEIAAYARRHDIPFPILKDVGNRLADALGAQRTPEVFVLGADRRVVYHGRIDDQYGVGYARPEPRREELKEALVQLLAGEPVAQPETTPVGCFIARVHEPKANASVTYVDQIAPILNRRCVECHRQGDIAPFALTEYEEAAGWAETIAEVVRDGRMPPWHANPEYGRFANDRALTDEEKHLIQRWVDEGAPSGDLTKAPKPPEFATGWGLKQPPDMVIAMADQPFDVPATGAVRYQYFTVDPGLKEDRWIKASEVVPGNRAVVHHVLVFAKAPDQSGRAAIDGFLASYVPGLRPPHYPQGMAKRLVAGSKLIFQVHYTPIGTPQTDLSKLGLVFADDADVKYEVVTSSAAQQSLHIKPELADQAYDALSQPAPSEVLLLSFMPHMHLRGQAFRYEAVFPDGRRSVLLDIPRYDFNWQTDYMLAEPLRLPAGSRIACRGVFDNSADNLNNPDPSATVRWGDQTWDEMLIGYFNVAVARQDTEARQPNSNNGGAGKRLSQNLDRIFKHLDRNSDGFIAMDEAPNQLKSVFVLLDANEDGKLSRKEFEAVKNFRD